MDVEDTTNIALHGDAIRAVAFNVDGSLFTTVGDDKRVKLWDAKTWTCIKTMYVGNPLATCLFKTKFDFPLSQAGQAKCPLFLKIQVTFSP